VGLPQLILAPDGLAGSCWEDRIIARPPGSTAAALCWVMHVSPITPRQTLAREHTMQQLCTLGPGPSVRLAARDRLTGSSQEAKQTLCVEHERLTFAPGDVQAP
jgi:hypothetical protein